MNAVYAVSRPPSRPIYLPPSDPAHGYVSRTRVAVFGSFHGGHHLLRTLLSDFPDEVRVVGLATDNPAHPFTNAAKRLWKYPHTRDEEVMVTRLAEEHGLPVYTGRVKSDAFHRVYIDEWRPDLCLMATFGQKIPSTLIEMPPLGFYNFHHSDDGWPSYPGPDPIRDMIADGKTRVFLNFHKVTTVLDGGELVGRSHGVDLPPVADAVQVHRRTWPQMTEFVKRQVGLLVRQGQSLWPAPRPETMLLV